MALQLSPVKSNQMAPPMARKRFAVNKAPNPEKAKEASRRWRAANPDWHQKNYAANRAEIKEATKKWRAENPEKAAISRRRWYASNLEKFRAYTANRRARKRKAAGKHSATDIRNIFKMQRGKCAYFQVCGNRLGADYHCDHIVPLTKDGSNEPSNIQLTCRSCNLSKHDCDPIDYARRMGMLL